LPSAGFSRLAITSKLPSASKRIASLCRKPVVRNIAGSNSASPSTPRGAQSRAPISAGCPALHAAITKYGSVPRLPVMR
jgi:hypothetical protein